MIPGGKSAEPQSPQERAHEKVIGNRRDCARLSMVIAATVIPMKIISAQPGGGELWFAQTKTAIALNIGSDGRVNNHVRAISLGAPRSEMKYLCIQPMPVLVGSALTDACCVKIAIRSERADGRVAKRLVVVSP